MAKLFINYKQMQQDIRHAYTGMFRLRGMGQEQAEQMAEERMRDLNISRRTLAKVLGQLAVECRNAGTRMPKELGNALQALQRGERYEKPLEKKLLSLNGLQKKRHAR